MWWALGLCVSWALYFANGQEFILPGDVIPSHYDLKLLYDIDPATNFSFFGVVDILLKVAKPTRKIVLHAKDFIILKDKVRLIPVGSQEEIQNKDIAVTNVVLDSNEFLTLDISEELLLSEVYSLSIPFNGNLDTKLDGAYIDAYLDKKTMTKEYSLIAIFEPILARTAFPCFDEPEYKATFKLTIGHHEDYHALSNMPLDYSTYIDQTPSDPQNSWPWNLAKYKKDFIWDHFGNSLKMSSYLVSYVISKLVHVESPNNLSKTKIRIWARRDVIDQASYAALITPELISYYENFFNVPYALPKMDHIAVKSFSTGGFEGWGLITYKELYVLYDEKQTTLAQKKEITNIFAHEVSHQWFGNLVTMKWWTELWLKEGFANFLADLAMTAVWPEIGDTPIVNEMTTVLKGDALHSSHPVTIPMEATTPTRIQEIYDDISYSKGAILIRMLYLTLGEKVFKQAIHNYLVKHSYNSTVKEDLWDQLTEVSLAHQALPSNITVSRVMAAWIEQAGYPLLTVTRDYKTKSLSIHQERYSTDMKLNGTRSFTESWWVPLSVMAQRDQQGYIPITWLADNEGTDMSLPYQHSADEDEWLLFNVDMIALCRVNYDPRNWYLLMTTLKSSDYTTIPTLSRVQLLMDAFELAWTNKLDYGTTLELASYLHQEEDHRPLDTCLQSLNAIGNLLKRSSDYGIFQKYVRRLIEKTYDKVVLAKTVLKSNDYNTVMMRISTSKWAYKINVPGCEENALKLFQQWMDMNDPDKNNPIPAELREAVYCEAIARGSARHWDFILERAQSASGEGAYAAMVALACTGEAWLLQRTLQMTLQDVSESKLGDHTNFVLIAVIKSTMGFYIAKEFIYEESTKLFKRFQTEPMQFLRVLVEQFTSQRQLDEFMSWRDTHAKALESSTFNIALGVDQAKANIAWMDRNRQTVVDKLKQFSEDSSEENVISRQSSKTAKIVLSNVLICLILFSCM